MHAHAAGERRIDVQRLLSDPVAAICGDKLQGAHVVQAIGELDQQHAHVVGDGQQKLAQVFGLFGLTRDKVELGELGQSLDERTDLRTESLVDLVARRRRVLDRVVQQRGRDRRVVQLELRENRCDFERMGKIRITRGAALLTMGLHGVDIGAVQQRLVSVGIIGADLLDEVVLAHHHRAGGLRSHRHGRLRRRLGLQDLGLQGDVRTGRHLLWCANCRCHAPSSHWAILSGPYLISIITGARSRKKAPEKP